MKVQDLVGKSPVDEITVKVDEKAAAREVRGGTLKVADCQVSDETGSVTLTLWNEDIDKVEVGDSITIKKGWVNEYQGKKQLSAGRFGEMIVTKGEGAPVEKKEAVSEEVLDAMDDEII